MICHDLSWSVMICQKFSPGARRQRELGIAHDAGLLRVDGPCLSWVSHSNFISLFKVPQRPSTRWSATIINKCWMPQWRPWQTWKGGLIHDKHKYTSIASLVFKLLRMRTSLSTCNHWPTTQNWNLVRKPSSLSLQQNMKKLMNNDEK